MQNQERTQRWSQIQDEVWREVFLRTHGVKGSVESAQETADAVLAHMKRPKHLEVVARNTRDPL